MATLERSVVVLKRLSTISTGYAHCILDIETSSSANLTKVGAPRYAADASTSVTVVSFAIDEEPAEIWYPDQAPLPERLAEAAADPDVRFIAHNAAFEIEIARRILTPRHGLPEIALERWVCTMTTASAVAMPPDLEKLALALGLQAQKDPVGKRLMKQMSRPAPSRRHEPDRLLRLGEYCKRDVEATREAFYTLPAMSDAEQRLWLLNARINAAGVPFDRQLVVAARALAECARPELDAAMAEATNGEITTCNQVKRLAAWLDARGYPVDSVGKETIEKLLASKPTEQVRRVLELRQAGAINAVAKFDAIVAGLDPTLVHDDASKAKPWLDHVHKVYPQDAKHIIAWLAHRVQRPAEKINHALVLGGKQGIGKDSLLEPVKRAVGPWNVHEVSPQHLLGKFCNFLKSTILCVNEGRDLGEFNRYQFYEQIKPYAAAPPDTLRVNEKHLREYYIFNVCGVIITSNYKTDGLFLPADDRRHYVAWSDLTKDDFKPAYWNKLWKWYDGGGDGHVAAYLAAFDLSDFDPKAPPPKTDAFWAIADANHPPEEAELTDALDLLANPDAVTLEMIRDKAIGEFEDWLRDRKNRRAIPYRMEACGYMPVRNPAAKDGYWCVNGIRSPIYAKATLPPADRLKAVKKLAE
jgi:Family of unknown function (DUF5906)